MHAEAVASDSPTKIHKASENWDYSSVPIQIIAPKKAVGGLLTRKERWGLTWRGWLIAVLFIVFTAGLFIGKIYPFLAVTDRVDADYLVVEGWVHDSAIQASIKEFKTGHYRLIFTTGGPVRGSGGYTNDFNTSASVAAERLVAAGMANSLVQMVPSRVADRDRTYGSAIALKNWLKQNHLAVHSINVVTEDVHARRTRLLFQRAFGNDLAIGIIAVPATEYDPTHWWVYSEGVEGILMASIAYVYARLLFQPENPAGSEMPTATAVSH